MKAVHVVRWLVAGILAVTAVIGFGKGATMMIAQANQPDDFPQKYDACLKDRQCDWQRMKEQHRIAPTSMDGLAFAFVSTLFMMVAVFVQPWRGYGADGNYPPKERAATRRGPGQDGAGESRWDGP